MTRELDPLGVPLEGMHVIEASAGTGKTYTMTTLVLRLLLERDLTMEKLLVVTFTRAAAAELRARIWRRLGQALDAFEGRAIADDTLAGLLASRRLETRDQDIERLRVAMRDFDEAAISTIHGFCQRILHEHAFDTHTPFETELIADDREIIRETVDDYWARSTHRAQEVLVDYLTRSLKEEDCALPRPQARLSDLKALAHKAATFRGVPCLPAEAGALESLDPLVERWHAAAARVREAVGTSSEEVGALLSEKDVLHKVHYGPGKGPDLALLARVLDERRPCIRWDFPRFQRLTNAFLREKCRKGKKPPVHPFFDLCDRLWDEEIELERALFRHALHLRVQLLADLDDSLAGRKQRMGRLSYDDLLHRLHHAVVASSALRQRLVREYPAVLIDEFQDTDPVQYRIFRALHQEDAASALFLIGDPKQAIYGFRGADVHSYFSAVSDAGPEVHTLQTNYRSDRTLVETLDALWRRSDQPFLFPEIGVVPVRPGPLAADSLRGPPDQTAPVRVLWIDPSAGQDGAKQVRRELVDDMLARGVAAQVQNTLASGLVIAEKPIRAADIAVLTRSNKQAMEVQDALRALRIPAVLYTDASVFDTQEAVELEAVLLALADPGDRSAVRAAWVTSLLGFDGPTVQALEDDEDRWELHLERLRTWHEIWQRGGFIAAIRQLMEAQQVHERLLRLADGERRVTNINHLVELIHQASFARHMGPAATVAWLAAVRSDEVFRRQQVGDSAQLRLESDEEAVKLVTIHKSKGLEYPLVFCTHLWDGNRRNIDPFVLFHDERDENVLKLDIGSEEQEAHRKRAQFEDRAENTRVLYVALTRAKHRVDIVWGSFKDAEQCAVGRLFRGAPAPAPARADGKFDDDPARIRSFESVEHGAEVDLREAVKETAGTIYVGPLAVDSEVVAARAPAPLPADVTPRRRARTVVQSWSMTSFSRLVRRRGVSLRDGGPDHDERDDSQAVASALAETPRSGERVILADFPAGARAGDFFHGVLEDHDFTADSAALDQVVEARLRQHGFIAHEWQVVATRGIGATLQAPLWPGGPALNAVDRGRRVDEMEFVLPVQAAPAGASGFSARSVVELMRQHGSPATQAYAEVLARLGFPPLVGFLRGFVDLMFEWDGRYYVVDYKSNLLGAGGDDYAAANLAQAMIKHHYVLQSLLYCLAVHRHLSSKCPGYDYERHFGGAAYLFLRGMDGGRPPGHGVHFDRPALPLIEGLTRLLDVGVVEAAS